MLFYLFFGLITLFSLILLILCLFLFGETLLACFQDTSQVLKISSSRSVILVPAHNEASVIRATLTQLQKEISPNDQIFVIADNCTDQTAAIAGAMGVEVLKRVDPDRRGKGYALDFGLQAIAVNPPEVIIIVDADCLVQADALKWLKYQALKTQRPAQAIYLMAPPMESGIKAQISTFAFKVKNLVRPLGLKKIGIPCPLTGTGMAFPWPLIHTLNIADGEIVEDMKMGLDLAISGTAPLLCPEARVIGQLPSQDSASTSQRQRWEHGHLEILKRYVPQLFTQAIKQKRFELALIAWDLAIPPLSLLVLFWLIITSLGIGFSIITTAWFPMLLAIIAGMLLFLGILIAWLFFGQADLSIQTLLLFPLYLLWKIPLYIAFLINPQKQWIRTERDQPSSKI